MAAEPIEPGARVPIPRRGQIRRCRVRLVSIVPSAGGRTTEVLCTLGGLDHALPLGTMDDARPICNACVATTVWRADEE